jgi:hypothetical protein
MDVTEHRAVFRHLLTLSSEELGNMVAHVLAAQSAQHNTAQNEEMESFLRCLQKAWQEFL